MNYMVVALCLVLLCPALARAEMVDLGKIPITFLLPGGQSAAVLSDAGGCKVDVVRYSMKNGKIGTTPTETFSLVIPPNGGGFVRDDGEEVHHGIIILCDRNKMALAVETNGGDGD